MRGRYGKAARSVTLPMRAGGPVARHVRGLRVDARIRAQEAAT